jgi:hypothetical protein
MRIPPQAVRLQIIKEKTVIKTGWILLTPSKDAQQKCMGTFERIVHLGIQKISWWR